MCHRIYKTGFEVIKYYALSIIILTMNMVAANASDLKEITVLAFGDSLTAGYGLKTEDGFTHQLEQKLKNHGIQVNVINAGLSGDTTSGGLSRLEWVLASANGGQPDLVILELGGNDALRGVAPKIARDNLDNMLAILTKARLKILLTGMLAPPNMGPDYAQNFNPIYADLSKKYQTFLYPFFLDGVAGNPSLNQDDGMHPNPEGVRIIVDNITPQILNILQK